MCKLRIAEQNAGGEGFVTTESLRGEFSTSAWQELDDEQSPLYKIITSNIFKNTRYREEQIDAETLALFAILHCSGRQVDKAEHLYSTIQEGSNDKLYIAAEDKDLIRIFEKICGLVSYELFRLTAMIDALPQFYMDDELELMREQVEVLRE